MNIVNKLTLRHLKENKGRTIVTTLGICISVAMITAVFVALASFLNLFGEIELVSNGRYNALLFVNQTQLDTLKSDERIKEIGIRADEEQFSFQLKDRKSDLSGTGDFASGDKTYIKQMVTGEYDGTLPSKINEIAIEQSLIDKNSLDWKIGDTVVIPTGNRYIMVDGSECVNDGYYSKGEYFAGKDKEYKITAILHNNPATIFSPIIVCNFDESTPLDKFSSIGAAINLEKINYKSLEVINEIIDKNEIDGYYINKDYLSMHFAFERDNEHMMSLLALCVIILVIIMIASVVLIYNAFAMSTSEKVRYLGMLASVGATRKQKRLSVYFESFFLGAVGIPIGIISGIIGIGITLKAIGGRIISTGMIRGIDESTLEMSVVIPFWAVVGIVIVSAFTVFISSFIPSRKASIITPIDAIRQTHEVKVKAKKLRSSKLIRKIFGYEGELANKNLKRNGRKSRVITASISLSVILFLCCNFFCSAFTYSVDTEAAVPYQLNVNVDYKSRDILLDYVSELNAIDDFYGVTQTNTYISDEEIKKIEFTKSENLTSAYKSIFDEKAYIYVNAIDDERFNTLCSKNGLNSNEFYGENKKALLLNNISHSESDDDVFTNKIIGKSLDGLFAETEGCTIAGLVNYDNNNVVCKLNPKSTISFYVPFSQYSQWWSEKNDEAMVLFYNLGIETDKHSEVAELISEHLNESDAESFYVNDMVDSFQAMNTVSFVIKVLVYGYITLISLITIFNIINTISTGVAMRKKEFAMLKSVGTTPRGFNRMIMLESGFYGIKALIFALPISVALSYLMNRAISPSGMIPFKLDIWMYVGVIAVVFIIVGATMLYSVAKLRNDNIVEALKEEIN